MNQITEITSEPQQQHFLIIEGNYDKATLTLEYKPNLNAWFYSLVWQTFSIYNQQLCRGPNIIRQFKNQLPFGIGIVTKNNLDPMTDDEFTNGNTSFYLLNSDDVTSVETYFYGG